MELKTVGKFSSCISDVDFELLNTEFIVDLCFGFGKPNKCVGFAGLDLNSFGTTLLQHHTVYIRGTQRQFSVKYLFGEAQIAYNFLYLGEN